MVKTFKYSRFARFKSMGNSALKVGSHYFRNNQVKAAAELVKNMGELKGAVMKVGQMLSITEDLILPKEVTQLFKELQKDAPPMSDTDLNKVFLESFNQKPEEIFSRFERKPMASASIGQVHIAYLKTGEKVAVKVQYPNIKEAIIHDFKNLDLFDHLLGKFIRNKPNIETTIEEIKKTLVIECDYKKEASELEKSRETNKEKFPMIKVPRVYREYSSEQVLTMEYLKGDHFDNTLTYPQEFRDKLGQSLYDHFLYSFYVKRHLHSDPQNGNYLFSPTEISLLDFGSTKIFDDDFVLLHLNLIRSLENDDFQAYSTSMIDLGFFTEKDLDEGLINRHYKMLSRLFTPYTLPGKRSLEKLNPFNDAKEFIQTVDLKGRNAPRVELVHHDRALLGLYSKLRAWNSSIDWLSSRTEYQNKFLSTLK